eukprot:375266-Rhodomonas_salina.1
MSIEITDGGSGYDLTNPPIVKCPEGSITATDPDGYGSEYENVVNETVVARGGSGFEAFFSTDGNGVIDRVLVTNAGRYASVYAASGAISAGRLADFAGNSDSFGGNADVSGGSGYSAATTFNYFTSLTCIEYSTHLIVPRICFARPGAHVGSDPARYTLTPVWSGYFVAVTILANGTVSPRSL